MTMNIEINGKMHTAKKGETLLTLIKRSGINIPTLCNLDDLSPSGACRLCVVEVEGARNLIPSCSCEVAEGMKVKTHSTRVLEARKTIVELLLSDHPDDCLYCNRNGNCELQKISRELGIRERVYKHSIKESKIDNSGISIVRDPNKCVLCGRCVRVCEEIQGVSAIDFIRRGSSSMVAPAFEQGMNVSSCVNCGQCINVCPTGALSEKTRIKDVLNALSDPTKIVIAQHAPAISVTIGEHYNVSENVDVADNLNAALRQIGFKYVFDTSFSADLTIMEEASELVQRIQTNGKLPMFTSCSPAWIKFVEQFYPEFIDNLSTCKSPQQMLGAIIKSYFAQKQGIKPEDIYVVSIMPCVAKKFEADRPEMIYKGLPNIDSVITTRELAKILDMFNINLNSIEPESADNPFGERSSAGKLFGVSGGVMEAAIRTANFMLTGKELANIAIKELRNLDGVKEFSVEIGSLELSVAVVNGLQNARNLLEDMKKGIKIYHFVEVMSCPGGCINGGGQPTGIDKEKVKKRMKLLYKLDKDATMRTSHSNPSIKRIYEEFLEKPLGKLSHKLLHTKYSKRKTNY